MPVDLHLTVGDTNVPYTYTITDAAGPVDLTAATSIAFHMAGAAGPQIVASGVAVKNADQVGHRGQVTYTFLAADTLVAGTFLAEFKVVFPGETITYPPSPLVVVIRPSDTEAITPVVLPGTTRPCQPWSDTLCGAQKPGQAPMDPAVVANAHAVATEILWALSGRRYGICSVTVLPAPPGSNCGWPWYGSYWPGGDLGDWPSFWLLPLGAIDPSQMGTSLRVSTVDLLKSPVRSIVSVKIDGVTLAPTKYRLDDWHLLRRVDGLDWPQIQDLNQPDDTHVGTFSITYTYGTPPPMTGRLASGQLAYQIARLCTSGTCDLPATISQISRQGESVTFVDLREALREGRTGLYLIDLFLAMANPNKLQGRPHVYRADDYGEMHTIRNG